MRTLLLVSIILGVALCAVVDLTPDNIDSVLDGSKHVFVEFYAPWCGHCKNLAPAYEEVGAAFGRESSVIIAKVDADAHKEIGSKYGVSGFPTLKFFKKGDTKNPLEYEGGREASDIVTYVNSQAGTNGRIIKAPSNVVTLDPSNFDAIVLNKNKDVLVEFYAPWCGHCKNLVPTWEKLAGVFKNDQNVVVAKLDADAHKDLGTKHGVSGFPTIIYFSKDNKAGETFNGGRDLSDFVKYLNEKTGSHRTDSGLLDETVGRYASLDELAKKFLGAKASEQGAIIMDTQKEEQKLKSATWYSKMMSVIAKKGNSWVASEVSRVDGLLKGGALSADKVDEFCIRRNVLAAFSSA